MSAKTNKKFASHRKLFLVGKDAPFSFVEAYKSLRTNLEFLSTTSNCKTILITSSVPEEGKMCIRDRYDAANVTVQDLEITNHSGAILGESYSQPDKMERTGVAVVAKDKGTCRGITLRLSLIHI